MASHAFRKKRCNSAIDLGHTPMLRAIPIKQ